MDQKPPARPKKQADKRLPDMSANMLWLHTNQPFDWRRPALVVLAVIMGLIILVAGVSLLKGDEETTALKPYAVTEGSVHYTMDFYPSSVTQETNGIVRTTGTSPLGQEMSFWIVKLDSPLSCGKYPSFSYTSRHLLRVSCYQPDKRLYVANIEVEGKTYQINLVSKQPIKLADAADIFTTVSITK